MEKARSKLFSQVSVPIKSPLYLCRLQAGAGEIWSAGMAPNHWTGARPGALSET